MKALEALFFPGGETLRERFGRGCPCFEVVAESALAGRGGSKCAVEVGVEVFVNAGWDRGTGFDWGEIEGGFETFYRSLLAGVKHWMLRCHEGRLPFTSHIGTGIRPRDLLLCLEIAAFVP